MSDPTNQDEHGLGRARANRASVRRTSSALEGALAEASRPDPTRWLSGVGRALDALDEAFARHIAANEAPGGLLADMVDQSPRLAHLASQLRRDHDALNAEIGAFRAGIVALSEAEIDTDGVSDIRARGLALLRHLSEHRHLGVEIVYEAYFVDIEAAD
jgi:phage shock protein A